MKCLNNRNVFWLVLGSAAVFAGAVSLYIGMQQSVWFDEAYSVLLAEHSWIDIVRLTAQDVHPPVYYGLLKVWMMVFGSSELAIRSLSAVLFGLSVGVAGMVMRRLFGTRVALTALPFVAFAPFLLRYGFEIRMYALASLIGVTATYILLKAVETEERQKRFRYLAIYGLLVLAGVYTLYFMALIWIAHLTWLMILAAREKERRTFLKQAVVTYACSFVLFLPWLPNVIRGAGGGTLSPVTHSLGPENLKGIVTYLFLYQPPWKVSLIFVIGIMLLVGAVAVFGYKQADKKERRYVGLLAAYFVVPIAVLFVLTQFLPIYLERYLAHFALGGYACLGVLTALMLRQNKLRVRAIGGALCVVLIIGCISFVRFGNYNFQRIHTPSVKQVAAQLSGCKAGAVIFADGPQIAMELNYYIKDCPVYFFNETLEMGGGFAMMSGSPLRVGSSSELPEAEELYHVYYDKPKNAVPSWFFEKDHTEIGAISITTYQSNR